MKNGLKVILFYLVLIIAIILTVSYLFGDAQTEQKKFSDIANYFHNEQVKSFVLDSDNVLTMKLKDGQSVSYELRDYSTFQERFAPIAEEQLEQGIISEYDTQPYQTLPWWVSLLPYVLVIVIFIIIWVVMMNQASGKGGPGKLNSFGKARPKVGNDEKSKVYFTDVAGADEEKEELREIVEYLREPSKFTRLGAKIPRGVLLMGPPGTGKTLLAKAVAGEAGVPFLSISGSDFVEMYVGVGASRVRDLFETARKYPASIIFIDEIDAVGRHRGAGLGGGHDEREQTLNQLLVEMDGFGTHDGVIVMAATNRPDILDPALLRPGRFDRQITVNYPDLQGRVDILKVHSRKKPLEESVDLEKVAQSTVGFTGADLANLLNEAALTAARKGKSLIGMTDIEEATMKIIVGMPKHNRKIDEIDKRNTAYHEAGHAILAHILPTLDPVQQISIIPSGQALGYTLNPPQQDKVSEYKEEMIEHIAMLLGGRAAEQLVFGNVSGGASNDIQRATETARRMVTKYGMSDVLGPMQFGSEGTNDEVFLGRDFNHTRNYSEATAATIDAEIKRFIMQGYDIAKETLQKNMEKLHFIAKFLIKYETMDATQFAAVMDRESVTEEELVEMVAEKKRRSDEENERRRKAEEEARKRDEEAARLRDAEEARKQQAEEHHHHNNPFSGGASMSAAEQYIEQMRREQQRLREEDKKNQTTPDQTPKDSSQSHDDSDQTSESNDTHETNHNTNDSANTETNTGSDSNNDTDTNDASKNNKQ